MSLPLILSAIAGGFATAFIIFSARLVGRVIPSRYRPADNPKDDHIQIVVMGDIGRSPRMQYHALSVARHGGKVDLVGFKDSARHPDLIGNPRIGMYELTRSPEVFDWGTMWFFLAGPLKAMFQFWTLFYNLTYATPPAKWIIIQNPPAIPTLHVVYIASLLRGSKVLLDWHNYGSTILAVTHTPRHLYVWIYRKYETFWGRRAATANLAVTDAMARQLTESPYTVKTPVLTLHDRPAAVFQPVKSAGERKAVLERLAETKDYASSILAGTTRLIVSSTSWTPDEDFGLLLDALVAYAAPAVEGETDQPTATPILAIITGRGPERKEYEERIRALEAEGKIPAKSIKTAWLSTRDYAALLSCADLGVCLHKSSSGVDLPMKVVDMFGAGLPVAAYSAYESFGELVKEGQNGCGFETASELTEVFRRLLSAGGKKELAALKKGAVQEGGLRWDEEWDRVVARVIGVDDTPAPVNARNIF